MLVHGAFADASSFAALIPELLHDGLPVVAPALANRGLTSDAAYVASKIHRIDGPVLLVGHAYGGAVITVAGVEPNVVGLVYLSGYALEEGETIGDLEARFPAPELSRAFVYSRYPVSPALKAPHQTEISVEDTKFPALMAHDLDPGLARVLAVTQRPLAAAALAEPAPAAAWRTKPAWGVICPTDRAVPSSMIRFTYRRAGITTLSLDGSHFVMLSQPKAVANLIHDAAAAVTSGPPEA
jgi:pimeloyl-ACP methyl ester carboxylesterase